MRSRAILIGLAEAEAAITKPLIERGVTNFTISCLDITHVMLEREREKRPSALA